MDLVMPNLDGVEATRRIMARTPCPIVVVTASVSESTSKVFEALGAGALDAVNTPAFEDRGAEEGVRALLGKIEMIHKLVGEPAPRRNGRKSFSVAGSKSQTLVLIGASAGGPAALARILGALPDDFPAACVIVQHVDVQFVKGLAGWLNDQSAIEVRLAEEGDQPPPGCALLAGRDMHLVFASPTRLHYTMHPVDCSYRPSVNELFRSAAAEWEGEIIGVLLTGMGRDGAEGLLALNREGHYTIAQDRASSAVYGMPKAAAELKAATEILALESIAPRLAQLLSAAK
jgi:chemotaxis response regulator CheB